MPELSLPVLLLIGAAFIVPIIPNLWAIWHVFHRDFQSQAEKMGWLVAAMFVPVLGGVAYCIWGRKRGVKPLL